ncbi:helix-turn-helix transcriptional regulator [Mangrovibacterium marinum]|nr:plasmid maintenance system antidote protein [Mangrovibacterium marinum]
MDSIDKNITILKGIHPGFILDRELKKRRLPKRRLAMLIDEYPQLLGDITKGKRRINPSLSIRLGDALGIDESFFAVLQAYYDIEQQKKKQTQHEHPNLKLLRPVLFWDTAINSINWAKSKTSVIRRVFERGNEQEIGEIIRFYGEQEVQAILAQLSNRSSILENNIQKYLR